MTIAKVLANLKQWHVETTDVLAGLRQIPDETVQCVCTSPPYWGLRDYGVEGQLGNERTPEEFVANMVKVFREVRRVLRSDGTCWLNIGDSYNAYNFNRGPSRGLSAAADVARPDSGRESGSAEMGDGNGDRAERPARRSGRRVPGNPARGLSVLEPGLSTPSLKNKDLVGIPWLLAFALRGDGWYLRQEIIWHKPAPMPESVTDRCTKAHEQIFLLTKSPRYFYDAEAIREPSLNPMLPEEYAVLLEETPEAWYQRRQTPAAFNGKKSGDKASGISPPGGRNRRSVWSLSPTPFPGAHFATFPLELPMTCLKAGTSAKGQCPECGSPWERVIESEKLKRERPNELTKRTGANGTGNHCANTVAGVSVKTTGWQPTCKCGSGFAPVPSVVLDPFSGAATTGVAAKSLGLRYIGLELNPDYAEMSRRRIDRGIVEDAPKQPKSMAGQRDMFTEAS